MPALSEAQLPKAFDFQRCNTVLGRVDLKHEPLPVTEFLSPAKTTSPEIICCRKGVVELSEVLYFASAFDQELKDQSSHACECSGLLIPGTMLIFLSA
jgi:hypothetical protein